MQDARERMLGYLRSHNTMTLATWEGERPWASALFYASDDLDLFFLSDPDSRHCVDLQGNPRVAVTVQEDYHEWAKIKGIQIEGLAHVVNEEGELARAVAVYVEKYPFVAGYLRLMMSPFARIAIFLDRFMEKMAFIPHLPASPSRFYRVVPRRIWFTDNEVKFGNRDQLEL
ncbi:MAG: pyridoxamine 5'-phosphate oxidase family protein [Dehalococcoidia bacterium]|nr:pyridoxamine 5'-phosphate oxidase family protein [Dehalococcoidia bacterium]